MFFGLSEVGSHQSGSAATICIKEFPPSSELQLRGEGRVEVSKLSSVRDESQSSPEIFVEASAESLIESKTTTQTAPLEKILTILRTRKIIKYAVGKVVLDFGCGAHMRSLEVIGSRAQRRYGLDSFFKDEKPFTTADGVTGVGSFSDLKDVLKSNGDQITCIISLACFEHMESYELKSVLAVLHEFSSEDAVLVGTVPTPRAKPVLEFLSYKLRLIDPSQIEDHKVYYNRTMFEDVLEGTGWKISEYDLFQFGMNSFFRFTKA